MLFYTNLAKVASLFLIFFRLELHFMKIVGIISEYNPFHNGHARLFRLLRQQLGEDAVIVCAMSGSFVQRGSPAIYDKITRAAAAVECGANLVLELPVQVCLSSAEGFAAGGVALLGNICDSLCFGSEAGSREELLSTARALLSADFSPCLRRHLDTGLSFPAARQRALEDMGVNAQLISRPNDILGVEYCKAILSQGLSLEILPVKRQGDYHATVAQLAQPSATALRALLLQGRDIAPYVPQAAWERFRGAAIHTREAGERAMLYRLRTMTEDEFEALPYGSEGLWRKLMRASSQCGTLEELAGQVKSKRYTRSRLDRMLLCAFLGLNRQTMDNLPDYARVLAFDQRGRGLLSALRGRRQLLPVGQPVEHPQWELEQRCESLYGLFRQDSPDLPNRGRTDRVFYKKSEY